MTKFNANVVINCLSHMSEDDKKKKAVSNTIIRSEIKNVLDDLKIALYRQSRENAIKYILWQGLLNQYGLFGTKRNEKRVFGKSKVNYYDVDYKHGDLISIDFGTSNIDKEFSYTHSAIVLKSYTDYVVVIPITSRKEGRLESKPIDEQNDTMVITKKDFKDIETDSYIMLYQIRSVSKNRIQKNIGSIKGTMLLKKLDCKICQIYAPISFKLLQKEKRKNILKNIGRKRKIMKHKK